MTAAVIAHDLNVLYDLRHRKVAAVTQEQVRERAQGKLARDQPLTPGELSALLGVPRTRIHEMLAAGQIPFTTKFRSKHRIVEPSVVRKLLAEIEQDEASPPAGA